MCKSRNTMEECVYVTKYFGTFFLCYTWTTNEVKLVPPEVLVNIYKPSSFQDFLSLLKFIYRPFKIVSKAIKLYVCKSQSKCAYHNNNKILHSINFVQFSYRPILNPRRGQCLPLLRIFFCLPI